MNHFNENMKHLEENAEILKVLGHPIRLCIVKGLLECKGCNVTKIQDCLEIPQSTISQHLSKLKNAGIIVGQRKGLEITYRVSNPKVEQIIKALMY